MVYQENFLPPENFYPRTDKTFQQASIINIVLSILNFLFPLHGLILHGFDQTLTSAVPQTSQIYFVLSNLPLVRLSDYFGGSTSKTACL